MDVSLIKKTKNLNILTLAKLMAMIHACDLDNKQREINHVGSYSTANLGASTNDAFFAQPSHFAPNPLSHKLASYSSSGSTTSYPAAAVQASLITKDTKESIALVAGFMKYYNAFLAGDLIPPVTIGELDQIHLEDVEEIDISWQINMVVFRAKNFTQWTGKHNWGMNMDKKVGFNKGKLRCYSCHEPGHFAYDCTNALVGYNVERALVPIGNVGS